MQPDRDVVLVVYESMFGNTEAVARCIAEAVRRHGAEPTVVDARSAPRRLGHDVSLVLVGAPTHAFGMPRRSTRAAARDQGATGDVDYGIREWLGDLERPNRPVRAACFDTRIRKPFLPGSAAHKMSRRLRRLGFDVAHPVSFTVTATPGPLAPGELEKAGQWISALLVVNAGRAMIDA
jgi:flavorubredoxin